MTNTSSSAATKSMNTAISTRSDTSSSTLSKFLLLKWCRAIAMLSIPPPIPATMYASISGMPWIA